MWRQDTSAVAEPRAKLSRRGLRWALEGIVVQHLTVARVAEGLGVSWNTANDAVLTEGRRVLIDDPARFDGVTAICTDRTPTRPDHHRTHPQQLRHQRTPRHSSLKLVTESKDRGTKKIWRTFRGYWETTIEADLSAAGVTTVVVIPRTGKPSQARAAIEHAEAFITAAKWRTGCEGRILHLKCDWAWRRTRLCGHNGDRIWCTHGVFAHNLVKII